MFIIHMTFFYIESWYYRNFGDDILVDVWKNIVSVQVRVRAYDDGIPSRSSVSRVTVNVDHNLYCPTWEDSSVQTEIMETHPLGDLVAQVEAEDRDELSGYNTPHFTLLNDGLASQFFLVNSASGEVFQRRAVLYDTDDTTEYNVRNSTAMSPLNHFKPEFTIVIFSQYKPRIAVAILGL